MNQCASAAGRSLFWSEYRWVPWSFVAFFAVISMVLGAMVWVAVGGYTGLVTENAYNKGLAYNQTIAAQERQEALGWKGEITHSVASDGSGDVVISFRLSDKDGMPVEGAMVRLWMMRPTQAGFDSTTDMRSVGSGKYEGRVRLPLRGVWNAGVSVDVSGQAYQASRRIVVP